MCPNLTLCKLRAVLRSRVVTWSGAFFVIGWLLFSDPVFFFFFLRDW